MATEDLGKLVVTLEAQNGAYIKKIEQAEKRIQRFQKTNDDVAKHVRNAIGALGGFISLRAVINTISTASQELDKLADASDRLGILPEKLTGIRYAAQMTGVELATTDSALQSFVRNVSEAANGTGKAVASLKELNIDAKALNELPLDQRLSVVADAMNGVALQSDRVRLSIKLFGGEGAAFVNTLALGSKGLAEMQAEAERMGITFDRDAIEKVAQANDALDRMRLTGQGLAQTMAIELAPSVEAVAKWMQQALEQGGFLNGLLNTLKNAGTGLARILHGVAYGDVEGIKKNIEQIDAILTGGIFAQGNRIRFFGPGGLVEYYDNAELQAARAELVKLLEMSEEFYSARPPLNIELNRGNDGGDMGAKSDDLLALETLEAKLKQQIATYGMVGEAAALRYRLEQGLIEGVTEQDIARIELLDKEMQALDEAAAKTARMSEFAKQAARNIQTSFADGLYKTMKGENADLLQDWKDTLLRMVAEAQSAKLFDALGGYLKGKEGAGGVLGMASKLAGFAGMFDGGGTIPAGKFGAVAERRAELVDFGGGGILVPGPADITGGAATAQMMGGNVGLDLNIVNNSGGSVSVGRVGESNGRKTVELILDAVKSGILDGQLDQVFGRTYGMNRANGN